VTISSETTRQTFVGNGAQTVFNYTFLLPTPGQFALYYTALDGTIELVAQSAYTITGVGNAAGGSITYLRSGSPIAAGTLLTITRSIPYTQTTELGNQGAYYPFIIENALDRLNMQIQQLYTLVGLAPKAPITNAPLADVPTVDERRNAWAWWDGQGNLTSTAVGAPPTVAGSLTINGTQTISYLPVGNPVPSLASLSVTGETVSETTREFLASVGFVSSKGASAASPERDKVALYSGMIAADGTGDAWSFNTVLSLFPGATNYNALGYELDFNNLNGHRGDIPGASGLAAPVAYGLAITGVAAYRSTSALLITGSSSDTWNRGITITNGIAQSSIQDVSTAAKALDLQGSYDYAIDVSASVNTQAAIQMGWTHKLRGRTSTAANLQLIGVSLSDQVVVGDNGVPVVMAGTSVVPNVDNTVPLGSGSFRWTEVYAANGTINTSDPLTKKDAAPLASATAMLREVQPISFKFKVGGAEMEPVKVRKEVPVYETVEAERDEVVLEGGKAVLRKVRTQEKRRVVDTYPVVDANGQPVLDWAKPVHNSAGREIRPGQWVPRRHTVPRMEEVEVEEMRAVPRPGKRTHLGFSATDIKQAVKKLGLGDDLGVYVRADGVDGLRTDQLVAVLWQALREMDARVQELEDV
jgi:hypothetical protein